MNFEKLGEFYLGRPYDLAAGKGLDGHVLYDSRDLTTHAMIVGMTGSGKTGLGIALLEEAAIDGVPAIAIDPKGDLANLLLTFPGLSPAEFRPWVDEGEAQRAGSTPDAFAAAQAELWKNGLAQWGQDGARIERLRAAADFSVYTPASTAGRPLSVLKALSPPPAAVAEDRELFAERVNATASGLLSLAGVDAESLGSREHLLVAALLSHAWETGETLDLETLVRRVQTPPVTRLGALDVEAIFPAKDRLELGIRLNALIAGPGAAQWTEGEPLDIGRLLHDESGKPRVSVISIAHLADRERQFFVTLLLQEIVAWMRAQEGTGSLRAILYMDEVAGYLPPVATPPSKAGFLVLLKQARAYGLGLVLATQNPVDLDYKALSNIGTWFLGRLQTERDKARVLDGLESAAPAAGYSRADLDRLLSALGKRVFLLHNVKRNAPVLFETRWTMSYLRGPLSREQLKRLTPAQTQAHAGSSAAGTRPASNDAEASIGARAAAPAASRPSGLTATPPVLPSGIEQAFAPAAAGEATFEPALYACALVRFSDAKRGIDHSEEIASVLPFSDGVAGVDWSASEHSDLDLGALQSTPPAQASFAPLPAIAAVAKTYTAAGKDFARHLASTATCTVLACRALDSVSAPGEDERAFRLRLQQRAREQRDAEKDVLERKYAPKLAALAEKRRRAEDAQEREAEQASQHKLQTAVSFGATVLGAILGGKTSSVGRATTAARGLGRTMKESQDVERAGAKVETIDEQQRALEAELRDEIEALKGKWDTGALVLEPLVLKPKKADVTVRKTLLVWVPRA